MLSLRRVPRSGLRLTAGLTAGETTAALGVAHTAAGGEAPSAGWLLAIAATAYAASLLALRGRAPVRVVLPAMVGLQVLLHAWLVALTTGSGLHSHEAASDALLGLSWPMLLAHVAAGGVAAAAWLLRRRAVDVLVAWADVSPVRTPHRARLTSPLPRVVAAGRDVAVLPSRGPPAAALATA